MYLLALALVRLIRTLHSTSILPHRLRRAGHGRVSLKGREVYKSALAPSITRGGTRAGLPRRPETDRGRLAFGRNGAPPGPGFLGDPGPTASPQAALAGAWAPSGRRRSELCPGCGAARAWIASGRHGLESAVGRRRRWADAAAAGRTGPGAHTPVASQKWAIPTIPKKCGLRGASVSDFPTFSTACATTCG